MFSSCPSWALVAGVKIGVSSRKSADASKPYQLAISFGYTNGLKLPNGEFLHLTPDVLFYLSANNLLSGITSGFAGTLDSSGNASAAVNVPSGFPPNLGVSVFVSGIVIDTSAPGGVSTVFNTHWFVLS